MLENKPMSEHVIHANLIDLFCRRIYPASVVIADGLIRSVTETQETYDRYMLPGFVDAHVHIESSMLIPSEFGRLAVVHGSVATVSDPHEIANVCGSEGVQFMIDNSKQTPLKIFFGAPSCVPATFFETAGAVLDAKEVKDLLDSPDIWYLSEMMNYPGVLFRDEEVMAKLVAAKAAGKPIDGHAPGLRGEQAGEYASAGITTDHESFTLDEALDKAGFGMHCLIREGSAAKNFEALAEMIRLHPDKVMFCSDDKHPDELVLHHINNHVKRALNKGYDLFDVLRAASVNPVMHYRLPVGLLRAGDPADFILIDNPDDFNILQTWIAGKQVAENGKSLLDSVAVEPINNFVSSTISASDLVVKAEGDATVRVIEALEGQLITNELHLNGKIENDTLVADTDQDILKLVVVNRYMANVKPAIAFIRNFGLKAGALASSVAHDCHNIIAVGTNDEAIAAAVNKLMETKGGVCVADGSGNIDCMPLPVAGLMSAEDGYKVAETYSLIDQKAKALGTPLKAPFMTLSFMALLVIPALKLSDKGLFNGQSFSFTDLTVS